MARGGGKGPSRAQKNGKWKAHNGGVTHGRARVKAAPKVQRKVKAEVASAQSSSGSLFAGSKSQRKNARKKGW